MYNQGQSFDLIDKNMRHLLFNLQGVSEEEADEIRELLNEHQILFYETSAGRWRIGLAGIWLPTTEQKEEAQALLANYQKERYSNQAAERERLKQLGILRGIQQQFYTAPLPFVMALVGITIILSISILPFIG